MSVRTDILSPLDTAYISVERLIFEGAAAPSEPGEHLTPAIDLGYSFDGLPTVGTDMFLVLSAVWRDEEGAPGIRAQVALEGRFSGPEPGGPHDAAPGEVDELELELLAAALGVLYARGVAVIEQRLAECYEGIFADALPTIDPRMALEQAYCDDIQLRAELVGDLSAPMLPEGGVLAAGEDRGAEFERALAEQRDFALSAAAEPDDPAAEDEAAAAPHPGEPGFDNCSDEIWAGLELDFLDGPDEQPAGAWKLTDAGDFELREPYKTQLLEARIAATTGWKEHLFDYLENRTPYSRAVLDAALTARLLNRELSPHDMLSGFVVAALTGDLAV